MNYFSLRFKNEILEENYQKDSKLVRHCDFYYYLLIELILALSIGITSAIEDFTTFRIITIIIILFLSIIIYIVGHKYSYQKYLNQFFLIIHLFIHLTSIEVLSYWQREEHDFLMKIFIYSMPIFICFNTIILIKMKWILLSILNFVFHLYFIARTFTLDQINEYPIIIIVNFVAFFSFTSMSYSQEKTFRKLYELLFEANQKLINYMILLKNILPSPILIIDVGSQIIEFSNNSAFEFIKTFKHKDSIDLVNPKSFEQLCNILKPFHLLNSSKTGEDLIREFIKNKEAYLTTNNNKDSILLNNNINETEGNKIDNDSIYYELGGIEKFCFFQKQVFFEIEKSESSLENASISQKKYFNFKFLKILWEKKPSILLIIDDISDIHRIEELKHLDQYKDQLLATVSHDLRTPLNGMMGMIESVIFNVNKKKDKKNLMIAQRSGHLLLSMINDILDFSQIHNHKLKLYLEKIDLIRVFKETCKLIKFQAKSKGIAFQHIISETILNNSAIVISDSKRIQQILLNLLNNALKFTQKGSITLSLEKNLEENRYKIMVEDTGIGIPDSEKSKLFCLFGKLDDNSGLNRTGVGLGLTISQNLVKLLNKDEKAGIQLESELGKGSKFWFFLQDLPIISNSPAIERTEITQPYSFEKIHTKEIKKKRVLLVDDDMINIMVSKKYCEFFCIEYMIANDGREAVEIIENEYIKNNNSFDGIFMDCNMPFLDGYTASFLINKAIKEEKKKEIPIIAMTANILHDKSEKFLESGMKGFIVKPVSRITFGETLKKFMNF